MKNLQLFLSQLFGFILVISIIVPSFADNVVPVLLWGDTSPGKIDSNPLRGMLQADLDKAVSKKLGKSQPPVLVFVKNDLCSEDISKKYKKNLAPLKNYDYIVGAQSPLPIFKNLPEYNESMERELKELKSLSAGEFFIAYDTNLESVVENFNRIKESSPHLIGVLTGNECRYRSKRQIDSSGNDTDPLDIQQGRLLMYADEPPYLKINSSDSWINLGKPTVDILNETTPREPITIKMDFTPMHESKEMKITIQFEINVETGYYTWRNVSLLRDGESPVILKNEPYIYWGFGFSYHCAQNTNFSFETEVLSFKNLQIQLDSKTFGDTYDCIGFTSIPILSGMFVTAIVAIITIWGIIMIMDIRTMDRFDDPKGKTITVSATD